MPKKPTRPTPAAKQPTLGEQRALLGPFGPLLGMPGQVRLSAREQQPRPPAFIPPKGKRGGRGR
jgi:hypothetical protein